MATKRLRIRTTSGVETLELEDPTPLGLLKVWVEEKTGLAPSRQIFLGGFPQRPCFEGVGDEENIWGPAPRFVSSGDQLILKERGTSTEVKQARGATEGGKFESRLTVEEGRKCTVVRRVMPGDNSCCFHSVAYVLENRSRTMGHEMRSKVAEVVRGHPKLFTEDYLGMPPERYVARVLSSDFWGGAIELSVLSFLYEVEIRSFDVQHMGRVDRYGSKENYSRMVLLLYTGGNHYDALALSPYGGAPESADRVVFNSKDEIVFKKAQALVEEEFRKQFKK